MVKVKTLQVFEDLKEKVLRKPETETAVFECTEERYQHLSKVLPQGYIELVEEVQEEKDPTEEVEEETAETPAEEVQEVVEEVQEVVEEKPKAKTSKKK